jgi:hypothetical protein
MSSNIIAVPDAFASRITGYMRQQETLNVAVQTAVATAAEMLGVPEGYQYNPEAKAFVPAPAEPTPVPPPPDGAQGAA